MGISVVDFIDRTYELYGQLFNWSGSATPAEWTRRNAQARDIPFHCTVK